MPDPGIDTTPNECFEPGGDDAYPSRQFTNFNKLCRKSLQSAKLTYGENS